MKVKLIKMGERFKNPILWGSILSTICLVLSAVGIINISDATLNTIINSVLSILALIGVINTPTKNINYIEYDAIDNGSDTDNNNLLDNLDQNDNENTSES
ncbi:MAG: phage holin [Clostridia bacterium]|nr:phage holin [Clostridia bacterium]